MEQGAKVEEKALAVIKPDETGFLSPDPCCSGLLVYQVTLDLSILVYPLYRYQGDTAETQILLQHHFCCLKFFWDSFCLQEKPKLLYSSTFKKLQGPHHHSHSSTSLRCPLPPPTPMPCACRTCWTAPAYEQAKLFITSLPLNTSSFLCWDSLPPSTPLSLSCLINSSPSFFAAKIASSPGNNPSHSPLSGIQSLLLFSHTLPWLIVFIYCISASLRDCQQLEASFIVGSQTLIDK